MENSLNVLQQVQKTYDSLVSLAAWIPARDEDSKQVSYPEKRMANSLMFVASHFDVTAEQIIEGAKAAHTTFTLSNGSNGANRLKLKEYVHSELRKKVVGTNPKAENLRSPPEEFNKVFDIQADEKKPYYMSICLDMLLDNLASIFVLKLDMDLSPETLQRYAKETRGKKFDEIMQSTFPWLKQAS